MSERQHESTAQRRFPSCGVHKHLKLSLVAEAFSGGRFDVDGRVAVQFLDRSVEVALKGLAVGVGWHQARYLVDPELRWRVLGGKRYATEMGGIQLFPELDGTLRTADFASVGMGGNNAR
ncbi:hypothetical protein [Corallococcus exercitus]|uniref:Uncharacterized protein n=1 Tax=Corallococcus exercitus TaxID=2316736 RepID=A0A7Y4NBL9_9BACT|nr:hypothetical protein [Corallococcus exercitus]NOK07929.1 hypothetical protein [Corallococcus exercitus]